MNRRVLIRHSSGSKAGTVEEFPVRAGSELTFGREPACDVRFDQDRDEFVSRRHMKLAMGSDAAEFTILDLSARNGTFVNRHRVREATPVRPGDLVQLGAGGPEFVFDVAPADLRVTPVSEVATLEQPPPPLPPAPPDPGPPAPVEERVQQRVVATPPATMQRAKRSRGKRIAGVAVVGILLIASAAYLIGTGASTPFGKIAAAASAAVERGRGLIRSQSPMPPDEIAARIAGATVEIENAWKLVDTVGGRPIRQIYIPNRSEADGSALVPDAGESLPVFVLLGTNRLQPLLTIAADAAYRPIGGTHRGAGFVSTPDGLILTARSLTEPWSVPYEWPAADSAGVVLALDGERKLAKTAVIARRQFPRWLPLEADFVLEEVFDPNSAVPESRIRGAGRSESLMVGASGHQTPGAVESVSIDVRLSALRLSGAHPEAPPLVPDAPAKSGDRLIFAAPGGGSGTATVTSAHPDGSYSLSTELDAVRAGAPLFDGRGRVVAVMSDGAVAVSIRRALEGVARKPAN
jgi:serine protease Do